MAYGRAAYFCIFCALIWLLEQLLRRNDLPVSTLYGVTIACHDTLHFIRDLLVGRPEHMWARLFLPNAGVNLQTSCVVFCLCLCCMAQVSPTASPSLSWWVFFLRSTLSPSTCWSRLTCTFLEGQVCNNGLWKIHTIYR